MNSARVAAAAGIEGDSDLRRQIDGDSAPDSFKITVTLGLAGDFRPDGAAGGLGLHGIAGFDFNAAARGVGLDLATHLFEADASARGSGIDIAIHIAALNVASRGVQFHVAFGAGQLCARLRS